MLGPCEGWPAGEYAVQPYTMLDSGFCSALQWAVVEDMPHLLALSLEAGEDKPDADGK